MQVRRQTKHENDNGEHIVTREDVPMVSLIEGILWGSLARIPSATELLFGVELVSEIAIGWGGKEIGAYLNRVYILEAGEWRN
jgi:hypothetical protein